MVIFCFVLTIFAIMLRGAGYLRLLLFLHSVRNISSSKDSTVKLIKKRFLDCHSLGKKIRNTEAYIEKQIDWFKIFGIFNLAAGVLMLLLTAIIAAAFFSGLIDTEAVCAVCVLCTSFYGIFCVLTDSARPCKSAVSLAADYIENTLLYRLNGRARLERDLADIRPPSAAAGKAVPVGIAPAPDIPEFRSTKDAELFSSILKEFLS